jgi:hypothetical protein
VVARTAVARTATARLNGSANDVVVSRQHGGAAMLVCVCGACSERSSEQERRAEEGAGAAVLCVCSFVCMHVSGAGTREVMGVQMYTQIFVPFFSGSAILFSCCKITQKFIFSISFPYKFRLSKRLQKIYQFLCRLYNL